MNAKRVLNLKADFLSDLGQGSHSIQKPIPMTAVPPAASHDPKTDHDLLSDYLKGGGERSFAELTRRYAGLVYHAALRRAGEVELAEEVTPKHLYPVGAEGGIACLP